MVFNKNFKLAHKFYTAATQYLAHGISVLPVWGMSNPEIYKVPAANWKRHQRWYATPYNLSKWYREGCYQGIGVICGRLSNLLVLDFDDLSFYAAFCLHFPAYADTYTVRTPNGWHLYFHIQQGIAVPLPTNITGLDVQWEGRYVVAPPTHGYVQHHLTTPVTLDADDLAHISAWMNDLPTDRNNTDTTTLPSIPQRRMHATELASTYRAYADIGNRNNTLFQCACLAHNMGWTEDEARDVLSPLHVDSKTEDESDHSRHREAELTIQSAFRQKLRALLDDDTRSLPNTLTETMHQAGHTCAVQVLTLLRNNGHEPGTAITRPDLMAFCREHGLSYHTIKKTITLVAPNGERLLQELDCDAGTIPAFNKCNLSTDAKPSKSQLGRPPKVLYVPTDHEIATLYACEVGGVADYLPDAVLVSAKQTRMAAHRAFIARKPGMHRSTLLATRLGISKRTKNRYDTALPDLHKRPVYAEIPLYGGNLRHVLDEAMPAWVFLEDETGKRYPPLRGLAGKLLKQGRQIRLLRRLPNYYWVGTAPSRTTPTPLPERAYADKNAYFDPRYLMVHWQTAYQPAAHASKTPEMGRQGHSDRQGEQVGTHTQKALPLPPVGEVEYHTIHTPFADLEWEFMAQTIQGRINALGKGTIALRTVRRLMLYHGATCVWRTMIRTEIRHDVRDAPAFLTALVHRSPAQAS